MRGSWIQHKGGKLLLTLVFTDTQQADNVPGIHLKVTSDSRGAGSSGI